ncbi:PWWP domain protein [Metarhizium robertsii]|uniref:PWWP domain protein n=1 Tax=Metarhizium robertsii TaxID=568076 RepID=A0A0A1UUK6_9HYPO|nr:PWWP domain protein [Metarhizium robertsii]
MAEKASENAEITAPVAGAGAEADAPAAAPETKADEAKPESGAAEDGAKGSDEPKPAEATDMTTEKTEPEKDTAAADADVEMKDAADTTAVDADTTTVTIAETPTAKAKGGRRKSTGGGLSRKGSKARLTHTDAKPGDHFLVKLKGFPAWPAIICDEDMLPHALVTSRPVSAARPDGTYAEAFADGGKRINDRTFPVMYLHTNEFGWEKNTNLSELSAEKAKDTINDKMRKDLKAAYELAIEHHPVEYYKDILKSFQEELIAQEEARKEAAATPKKGKKGKSKAAEEEDAEVIEPDASAKKSKKRKAEDEVAVSAIPRAHGESKGAEGLTGVSTNKTPQRSDSVKKPKIKLNTSSTPKTANGAGAPKSTAGSATKITKVKTKKPKEAKEAGEKKAESSKETKIDPEERHKRKVKEVLFLRHKLQKGLLTREQQPKEEEMQSMSDFITLLEKFGDLEVSIIRATKINKVLKAILKLDAIPREEEFQFKKRSQSLLDKWNKLLASDTSANGVNGASESHAEAKKSDANGVKVDGEPKSEATTEPKAEKADAGETTSVKGADEVS